MSKIYPQVMQGTSNLHDQISKARLGVAKLVLDDATAFHAG